MNLSRQEIFIASTLAIAFCVSVVLVLFRSLQASLIGAAMVFAIAIAYRYPRKGLWLFLIYMPLAGTVSYSLASIYRAVGAHVSYSQDYALFHLAKDAFYLPALFCILISGSWLRGLKNLRGNLRILVIAILFLLGACLLTLFLVNFPQQLSASGREKPFLMGIIGLKKLVGYLPLMACSYYLIRDRQDLKYLFRLQMIISLVCCGLCLIQYLLLTQGICAGNIDLPEPAFRRVTLQARCFVGGSLLYNPQIKLISLPGTFVAPWQWAWFLIANSFFTAAATAYESSRLWRILGFISIALVIFATAISGQTTATLLVPIILFVLLWATERNNKWLPYKLGIATFLCILIANNFGVFGSSLDSIISRWNYSPPQQFIIGQFNWIIREGVPLLGQGLGRSASAARKLGDIRLIETFYPRLLYEIGWLGTLAFLGAVSLITIYTFKVYCSIQNLPMRSLGICLWLFILFISYNTFYYPLAVEPVNIYYWFFAGVLLKLPMIDRAEREIKD
ncbi:MAG: hypothetical protein QNJ34_07510 [Xenococcaceae cyanobacterium MO_188.B29]|nr:hypothetical protein [Xenococcaceae cyanobacterium MO_188.B29]